MSSCRWEFTSQFTSSNYFSGQKQKFESHYMISNNYLFTHSSERRRRLKFCLSFLAISKAKKKGSRSWTRPTFPRLFQHCCFFFLVFFFFALLVMLVALLLPQLLQETNRTTFLNRRTLSIKLWSKLDHFTI